jgi:putative spermidine/putrescine transport system substrate-binding protein
MGSSEVAGRRISRRRFLVGMGSTLVLVGLGACGSQQQSSEPAPTEGVPKMPDQPVNLTIIDVAGNLQLTRTAIEDYASSHSDVVRNVNFTTAGASELTSKIQAQQEADQVDIAVVLTGVDGLYAGIEQGIWLQLIPNFEEAFPDLEQNYLNPKAQELAQAQGILISYGNYGPIFTYNPEKVPNAPRTTDELLAYARQSPRQFMYARPANSDSGRILLMGLPYILEDPDPKDPETWDNTWSYLDQLDQYIDYYPSGTMATMEELGDGSRAIVASTMGWDMNSRILGTVPTNFEFFALENTSLISDGHYAAIPNGLDASRLAVSLDLIASLLQPDQQALAYDKAYFYPGPAVKGVTLNMAPEESQEAIASVERPRFDELIKLLPVETQLGATALARAFEIWDERVGGSKVKD